jgi:RNase adapter protein RapZ
VIDQLRASGSRVRVVFLDANDETLIRRYEGSRRRHPLAEQEGISIGVMRERRALEPVKARADVVIDTSTTNVHELRDRIAQLFEGVAQQGMAVTIVSFGYKHGLPTDVDLAFDLRFLPNPHWVDELRPFTGLDQPVRDYVLGNEHAKSFINKLEALLEELLPQYATEGKAYLSIGVGCTGGQHRSVAVSEELGRRLTALGYPPMVRHRDLHKR